MMGVVAKETFLAFPSSKVVSFCGSDFEEKKRKKRKEKKRKEKKRKRKEKTNLFNMHIRKDNLIRRGCY